MAMNSSSSNSSDPFRHELMQYVNSVNHRLFYVQACICCFGVLGNLLALIVINQKSLKNTSSAVFITYLAIFDSAVLLLHAAHLIPSRGSLFLHCSLTYLNELSGFCANWILVIITLGNELSSFLERCLWKACSSLERCIAIYSPFLAKRFCTIDSARYSMYILLITAVTLFSGAFPLVYQISDNVRTPKCSVRPRASIILRVYEPILFYVIPDLFLLSNLFTVYALCRRQKQFSASRYSCSGEKVEIHVSDSNSSRKQRQLTVMLVTVSLSFYLFTTPSMILFFKEWKPPGRNLQKAKTIFLFGQLSVICAQLNNATNFIFYCLAGQRFRHATMYTFRRYSGQIKLFYHRYILCNKQYHLVPIYYEPSSYRIRTMTSTRASCSPTGPRQPYSMSRI